MDLTKAQRLLLKIQAFIDNGNGNDISRLEKDLMKSYIIQLYDFKNMNLRRCMYLNLRSLSHLSLSRKNLFTTNR